MAYFFLATVYTNHACYNIRPTHPPSAIGDRAFPVAASFFRSVASRLGAPPTRNRGKLARQPKDTRAEGTSIFGRAYWQFDTRIRLNSVVHGTESPKRQRHYGNGVMERQYGHGFTETVTETETDERKRNAGNQAWLLNTAAERHVVDGLWNAWRLISSVVAYPNLLLSACAISDTIIWFGYSCY